MWKDDEITGDSDLSTSNDQDFVGIEIESFGTWFYRTTLIFLLGICADSYESAICGFWDSEMALNLGVI